MFITLLYKLSVHLEFLCKQEFYLFSFSDTGNENNLPGVKINDNFLLSNTTGEKIEMRFVPEVAQNANNDDDDIDIEFGYIKCQQQCLVRYEFKI